MLNFAGYRGSARYSECIANTGHPVAITLHRLMMIGNTPVVIGQSCTDGYCRCSSKHEKMEFFMRSLYVVLTSCLLGSQICSASLIDDLEDADFGLQPVSAIFDSVTERLDFGGTASTCDSSSCQSCECVEPLVPNMVGDNGLLSPSVIGGAGTFRYWMNHASKVSENNSATPRDRASITWNISQDVRTGLGPTGGDSSDIQEYKFLWEKTILNENASLEVLIPFNHTTEYTRSLSGFNGNSMNTELGDVALGIKALLIGNENFKLSTGLRVELPTEDDRELIGLFTTDNDIWAFTPYMALEVAPQDENWYFQMFGSARLLSDSFEATPGPINIQIPDFYMLDASLGYWLYRNPTGNGVTGIVPSMEMHYTSAIDPWQPGTLFAAQFGQTDFLNMTAAIDDDHQR